MQSISSLIQSVIHSLYNSDFTPEITLAPKRELGEYCINIFPLAKIGGKAPNIISEEIAVKLGEHTDIFPGVSATGGYVNFFLTDTVWLSLFQDFQKQSLGTQHGKSRIENQQTIVVDYIGMNVGKPPHIGHICTPLLGQAIINVLRSQGYHVIGDSHLGDWGLLFGKLIVGFKKYGSHEQLRKDAINHLLEIYIAINTDSESDPTIEQVCRDAFRALSDGNPEYTKLWAEFTTASIATNKKMLELMHIHQDYDIGESFYEGIDLPKIGAQPPLEYDMNSVVGELITRGIATENADGSVGVIFPEETKMPSTILRKKDGTNLYLTSDLAAIKYRITNRWNPSKILYFVDARQSLHLKQAFWIAKTAWGMEDIELTHAANGAIVLPEGAMSTRKGNIIRLDSLVEEGFLRVKAILEEKGRNLSKRDIREIAIGAIKYSYLAQDRERDIIFTWDKALNFEGNSGPYIQYAYVRARKISEASDVNHSESVEDSGIQKHGELISHNDGSWELSQHDKLMIQSLRGFMDAVDTTAKTYKPHHLALYTYSLATAFNGFYVHTPKIREEENQQIKDFRLALVRQTAETLRKSFALLGIEMPSEM